MFLLNLFSEERTLLKADDLFLRNTIKPSCLGIGCWCLLPRDLNKKRNYNDLFKSSGLMKKTNAWDLSCAATVQHKPFEWSDPVIFINSLPFSRLDFLLCHGGRISNHLFGLENLLTYLTLCHNFQKPADMNIFQPSRSSLWSFKRFEWKEERLHSLAATSTCKRPITHWYEWPPSYLWLKLPFWKK